MTYVGKLKVERISGLHGAAIDMTAVGKLKLERISGLRGAASDIPSVGGMQADPVIRSILRIV